uniref:Cytochrome c oxidase subunit 5C n=1 Tax=Setaria italica TaxID=4555 RepID=K3ZCA5_SETIT
ASPQKRHPSPHGSKREGSVPLSRGGGAPPPSPSPARHLASDFNSKQMAGGRVAHATLKGPSVVKEIFIGLTLGLIAGGMWKMHHWNEQRKTRSFYDMLDKGQISVVVEE